MMKTNMNVTINVLNGKFEDYNGNVDIDYMCGEIENYVTNCCTTEYLYHKLIDNRRSPIHSIAWSGLIECVNEELKSDNLQCTSTQLKKWFALHGLDYKEALKPVIAKLSEEREEMLSEREV